MAFDTSIIACSLSIDPAKVLVERESRLVDWMSMDDKVEGRIPAGSVPAMKSIGGERSAAHIQGDILTGYV